jgi:hypothetical protein
MAKNRFTSFTQFEGNNLSNTSKVPDINEQKYGVTPNAPKVITKPTFVGPDQAKNLLAESKLRSNALLDANEYGKTFTFDNSPTSASFKARYKAYGQDTYNRIGFDPDINNEDIYNKNTSTFDDMKRWFKHSAAPMVGLGFMAPIHSYGKLLGSGDVGADRQEAKDYEYYNSIGYSSRGGIGGFATNLLNSVSYSAGILLEGAVEGAMVSGAVGAATGGELNLLGGALGGVKALTKLPSALIQSTKNIGKIAQSLKNLKNISNAKNFWQSAGELGVKTLEKVNPLENTFDAVKSLSQVQDMSKLAKTARTAGAFWHDVMSMNMALSEGRLEGGFSEQNVYNKLYNDYYAKNGKAPSGELQTNMMLQAKEAGFKNTLYNTGLVFYSNKIAFPSITRAKFLKGAPKFNFGKVVGEVGKEFQIIFNPADDIAKATYTKEAITFKNSLKALKSPKQWGKLGLNYFTANLVEGVQEIGQEALAAATEKYYTDTFNNPSVRGYKYGMGALMDGLGKQLNTQGAETFASGFLMGGLLEGPSKMFKFGTKNFSRIFKDKAVYDEYVKQREVQADAIVNSLNNMHKNAKYFFDPRINNYSNQMLTAKMVDNPDDVETKQLKDAEFATFQSSVITALRTGTFDTFIDNLAEYKNTTPEELEQAWSLEPGQGQKALQNIDKAINSAKITAERYKIGQNKFKDFVDPKKFKEDSPEYNAAIIYNKAYEESISSLVFLQSAFDNNLDRLGKLYGELDKLKSISGNAFSNFSVITDPVKLNSQINYLKQEIESGVTSTMPEAIAEVRQKREVLAALNKFQQAQDNNTGENLQKIKDVVAGKAEVTPEINEYFQAFGELLEAIAGSEEKKVDLRQEIDKMGGPDALFASLLDIHLLKNDRINTAKYINILADPAGFYESVNKNFEWMKRMYDNRKEYYKDIVNQEIANVERNEILNTLASDGIFVDLEEFAKFIEDPENYLPEYFIDTTKEMVINKDSILYEDYAKIFLTAAVLAQRKPAGNPATEKQKLDDELTDLAKDKNNELVSALADYDQAFTNEVGMSVQDATTQNQEALENNTDLEEQQKTATEKITKLQDLLEVIAKDPVDTNAIVELAEELLTQEELLLTEDDIDVDTINAIASRKFKRPKAGSKETIIDDAVSVIYVLTEKSPLLVAQKIDEQKEILNKQQKSVIDIENTKSYKVYQERVSQINERYDALEAQILDKYKEKGVDKNTVDAFTSEMGYDNFPPDLQAQLDKAFDDYLINEEIEADPKSLMDTNFDKYQNMRRNWLENKSGEGQVIINKYNEQVKAEGAARAEALTKPPVLTSRIFKNLKIDATIPIGTLNAIIDKLESTVNTKIFNSGTNEVKLSEQDIKEITEDIEKLKTFLQYKQGNLQPVTLQEKVFKSFKQNVAAKQDELVDVFDEDGNKIGRKFADDPDSKLTTRVTSISDKIATEITGETAYVYSDEYIDQLSNAFFSEYNTALKKGDTDAFNKAWSVFTNLARTNNKQFNNPEKQAKIRESLELNTTEENFKKLLKAEAHSNNAKAGTRLDATVRRFFTVDFDKSTEDTTAWMDLKYSDTIDVDGVEMKISDIMSESAFENLFGLRGIVTRFRSDLDAKGFFPLTNNVKLFDKTLLENGVSGETDIVLINTKGEITIVDIKTATSWNGFNNPNSWKNVAYRAQLSIYRNLYHNMTGQIPKIALFPILVALGKNGSSYIDGVSVGGEKTTTAPLVPLVPNNAKLFNTLELEYLPEVETQGGITLTKPEEPVQTETITETEPEAVEKPFTQLTPSDTNKVSLTDNVGKQVVYNGKVGTLVLQDDGSYAVEIDLSAEAEFNNELLSGLKADLAFENGEFGNPERAAEITKQIEAIEKSQTGKEIYPVTADSKNVTDGNIELTSAGISLITPIENIGQVSMVSNQIIDARFENEDESIAIVNGVRYNVERNALGEITKLTYYKNEKRRNEIDDFILELNKIIKSERSIMRSSKSPNKSLNKIAKAKDKIKDLELERSKLSTEDVVIVYGDNNNDVIFALNRLPNKFQKNKTSKTGADTQKELKQIAALSEASPKVEEEIALIMSQNFPEELNTLFAKGISEFKGKSKELAKIKNWINDTIQKLRDYKLGDDTLGKESVNRKINVLSELLNNLNLINLTATNRVAKQQPYEQELNKLFGSEAEVQSGTGIPNVQIPTGEQTEGVSGQTSGGQTQEISIDELKKIVTSSVEELEGLESEATVVDKAVEAFAKIKDLESLYAKKLELIKNINSNKLSQGQINTAYDTRLAELEKNVDIASLKPNDILQDVTNFTNQDSPVQVAKVNKNSVILKYGDVTQEVTEEELVNNFVKPTNEPTMEEVVKPSQETVDASEQTKTDAKIFFENKKTEASDYKEATESNEDDLFKNLENNSKTC